VQRIVRGRSATLEQTFYSGAAAIDPDPDAATVTITRADGTPVVTAAPTVEVGVGVVSYTLTPAQTALLDTLTVTWTAHMGGQDQAFTDTVEIAGDMLFRIAAIRTLPGLSDPVAYPEGTLRDARLLAEQLIETECGRAFVPRYWYGRVDGYRWPFADVRAVRSARNTDGTVLAGSALADVYDGHFGAYYGYRRRNQSWTVGLERYRLAAVS
jgi:hypothetical protein